MPATAPNSAPLSHTVDIETPELVVLSYTVAGVGSRASAALLDYLICFLGFVAVFIGFTVFDGGRGRTATKDSSVSWAIAMLTLVIFAVLWLYYVLFEALADGQTPGKRIMRLRVVRDGGLSITFGASAVRNLVRIIDMQPGIFYAVGLIGLATNARGKRLGDWAAGTLVVKEDLVTQPSLVRSTSGAFGGGGGGGGRQSAHGVQAAPLQAALTEAEFEVLDRYFSRRNDLDAARQGAIAAQLATRFRTALLAHPGPNTVGARLSLLHDAEKLARARGASARHETGAARERHAIVAANSSRWSSFASRLADAQRHGLKSLGESGVKRFVQEYRELAADLARLRTATRGRQADEVFYLNRLVSTAHNLLYRRRSLPLHTIVRYLFTDVPREIRASYRPILLAAALLFGPTAIAWTAVVRQPEVAATLVPPGMLDRAERGVTAAKTGKGYIEDPGLFRPVMATSIITNNVQVAFAAFATGITAGVFTVWVLVSNGISIGAVSGLYVSKGIGTLLLKFVAPHGVLELTAICIAGGAGFLLAAALLIPGDRTRRTALIENGQRAIKLVAGASLLLVVAGSLEGFVSPIETWTLGAKLSVSGATAVLLAVYVSLARGGATALPATSTPGID